MSRTRYVVQAMNDKHQCIFSSKPIATYELAAQEAELLMNDPCYPDAYRAVAIELPSRKVVYSTIVSQERYDASHE